MNPLDDYFSLLDIARVLCRMRVRVASTRRKRCLYDKYFPKGSREQPKADKETVKKIEGKEAAEAFLASLLPPRRAWKRDNRASRKGLDSATIAEQSIFRVVRAHSRRGTLGEQTWGARLLAFCEGIRGRLSDPEFAFSAPSLVLLRKSVGRISAMDETARRRQIQQAYNEAHGITPKTIEKSVRDLISISKEIAKEEVQFEREAEEMDREELEEHIAKIKKKMEKAASELNFEAAAEYRDRLIELKNMLRDL